MNQLFLILFYVYFLHDPITLCLTSEQYHHRYLFFFKDNLKMVKKYAEHFQFGLSLPDSETLSDMKFCAGVQKLDLDFAKGSWI